MSSRTSLARVSALTLGFVASNSLVSAGPCDIYGDGGTPCVAAHSTTRALYSSYSGPLYQVTRTDGTTADIVPESAGGVAKSEDQDTFCSGTGCEISIIYDQSGKANHLTRAPKGGFDGPRPDGSDNLADATAAPIYLNGKKAYGVYSLPGTGYRNNEAVGTAVDDEPEGMYAVLDGTHSNDQCCFDYGNAEISSLDTGDGHMETIYFGSNTIWSKGDGSGPWIMGDLENGLFSGSDPKLNSGDPTITSRFLTAIVKGEPGHWAIRGGDAASGSLSTFWDGARPDGWDPMKKEGAIILGIGGDNSNGAQGTFYEGAMTYGYPSDDVENKIQEDILSMKYST